MVNQARSTRYQNSHGIPAGIGLREENIHPGSGLRVASVACTITQPAVAASRCRQIFAPSLSHMASLYPSGYQGYADGHTAAANGVWVSMVKGTGGVALSNPRLPVPMTPTAFVGILTLDNLAPSRLRLRVSGFDQFGNRVVETTPWIVDTGWVLPAPAGHFVTAITMSKVFSYVDDIEYMHDGRINGALSVVGMGYHAAPDPARLEAATLLEPVGGGLQTSVRYLNTENNWGIGSPLRLSPHNTNQPYRYAELIAASCVRLREQETPTIINTPHILPIFGSTARARVNLTIGAGLPTAGQTFTIGPRTYTFRASVNSSSPVNEVVIGADEISTALNIAAAINGTAGAGSTYSAGTIPHELVEVYETAAAAGPTGIARIQTRSAGIDGYTIATTETATNTAFSAAQMREGTPVAGVVLGHSLAGWEGCAHKIGFRSADDWTTKVLDQAGSEVILSGSSGVPAGLATMWRDEMSFEFTVRSSLGTQRDSASTSGYVS